MADLSLPSDLYWEHIRPFTPLEDRVVLRSTRFYHGNRCELDNLPSIWPYEDNYSEVAALRIKGEPGTPGFHLIFEAWHEHAAEYDEALEIMRQARAAWDDHLSRISSPTVRLQLCLKLFLFHWTDSEMPLFFAGSGSIKDVVQFHTLMNPAAINGPPLPPEAVVGGSGAMLGDDVVSSTHLEYWLNNYLNWLEMDLGGFNYSFLASQTREIIGALLDAGADISPLLKPMDSRPRHKIFRELFRGGTDRSTDFLECLKLARNWYRWSQKRTPRAYNGFVSLVEKLESIAAAKHPSYGQRKKRQADELDEGMSRRIESYFGGGGLAAQMHIRWRNLFLANPTVACLSVVLPVVAGRALIGFYSG